MILCAVLLGGCFSVAKPDLNSPDPSARNAGILRAAASDDKKAVAAIVRLLDSDDPATRVLAIQALERLTGERFGYDPAGEPGQRAAATDRWSAWLAQEQVR